MRQVQYTLKNAFFFFLTQMLDSACWVILLGIFNIFTQALGSFSLTKLLLLMLDYFFYPIAGLSLSPTKQPSCCVKALAHWVRNFRMRFSLFPILSYQNACNGCENAENRTWSEFFFNGRKFRRQCANVIDTTWGRIYFLTCENFGLSVQRPLQSERRLFACSTGESGFSCTSSAKLRFAWILFNL